jgi:hypothetical protein
MRASESWYLTTHSPPIFSLEATMTQAITLEVVRRLDDRAEGVVDAPALALKLHNDRKLALHDAFPEDGGLRVIHWGDTDDTESHEGVKLIIEVAEVVAPYVALGVVWLGKKLAEKAIDTALTEACKSIVDRLRPKQEARQVLDILITLPDGTRIRVDPPDRFATMTIAFPDQKSVTLNYKTNVEQTGG